MRIISLLPSATEILYLLSSGERIVGISHECDYPEDVKVKPVVTNTIINTNNPSLKIDQEVSKFLKIDQSIYTIDKNKFISLKPDLVITQKLCEVCAITPTDIQQAIRDCDPTPEILTLHPHSIEEILGDILKVGEKIDKKRKAGEEVKKLRQKMEDIKIKTKDLKKLKVYCMEWLDPPYNGGHWVPEQVEIAGGVDEISTKGIDSVRLLWKQIIDYDPEVLILMPCGFSIERTKKELSTLENNSSYKKLSAVKNKQVYLVNGPAYFNCSGPRVIDGIELLAEILHPEIFQNKFNAKDLQKLY
ncbi:cobalamin-binding protein [Candidatus Daviesbacteria bacterium]|nr:cobalamin-binding protein [Candidatus Daviesbacteria bacterium]